LSVGLFVGWVVLLLLVSAAILDQPYYTWLEQHVGREEGIMGR
jgi:hypothetical protein